MRVLSEPLREAYKDGTFQSSSDQADEKADEMAIDLEEDSSSMIELDNENGKVKKSHSNGKNAGIDERKQWCSSTLGYVKAFTRQYASEVRVLYP